MDPTTGERVIQSENPPSSIVDTKSEPEPTSTKTDSLAKGIIGTSGSSTKASGDIGSTNGSEASNPSGVASAIATARTAPTKIAAAVKDIPPNAASMSLGQAIVKFAKEVFSAFVAAYRKVSTRVDIAKVADGAIKNVNLLKDPKTNLSQMTAAKKALGKQLEILKTYQKNIPPTDKDRIDFTAGAIKACEAALVQPPPLAAVMDTYNPGYAPKSNKDNLLAYGKSEDCKRHAATARIYYNSSQLEGKDALKIVFQREPTNIAMRPGQYNQSAMKDLFGYEKGVYNDPDAKKVDGSSFKDRPNSAAVYSETYLWNPPGGDQKKEVACLSLPAPALDSPKQPHFSYYVQDGKLDKAKYEAEMNFLFSTVKQAIEENNGDAFGGKGFGRVVLSKFGQGAFLGGLTQDDRDIANQVYNKQLAEFRDSFKDTGLEIVVSEFKLPAGAATEGVIEGDILMNAQERDLIINAWDPHSAPGNGNDGDRSFDGAMGKGTGILLTQTSWLNETLKSEASLKPVG